MKLHHTYAYVIDARWYEFPFALPPLPIGAEVKLDSDAFPFSTLKKLNGVYVVQKIVRNHWKAGGGGRIDVEIRVRDEVFLTRIED